jgi:muconolactone delta-isomerase
MRILALERELSSAAACTPELLRAEARAVWNLQQQGIVREVYFRADRHEAVLMLECADIAEAQAHLAALPLVQAGLITFDVIPLVPYDGFARLFAE